MSDLRSERTTPIHKAGARPAAPDVGADSGEWVGTRLADRYRLDSVLGQGGMGVVYRGRDAVLERDVAVKVLAGMTGDAAARERLLREARAAAALNHPNVVSVYDAGEDHGTPFVVMELVAGKSLRRAVPATWKDIVATSLQICDALDHAHARGLVHRDLKPENVLGQAASTGSATWKLADLGLAVFRGGTRITHEGAIAGTVAYMAPEQALGNDVDARADLYALGVMLYEMVTRRLPFDAEDPLSVLSQHIHAPVVPPRAHRADVPRDLEAVILRLLSKDRDRRFATARETADALRNAQLVAPSSSEAAAPSETSASVALLEELARGRLVGRQAPLTELRDLWRRASEGHGHLALVSGEPGAGKTRLARELLVYAQLEGATVLSGGCYEYEAATPYMPFVEALRRWVRAQTDDRLRDVLTDTAPTLARLAPEIESRLGPFPPRPALPAHEERLLLFDHFVRFLRELAGTRGLLVYVDDLHWADQGTVGLLNYLLHQVREERILIAASYREIELDRSRPLATSLHDWNRERLSTRISLERLSKDETASLLATLLGEQRISADFTNAVYRETEGNPFFVEEVLKSLIEHGKVFRKSGKWDRVDVMDLEVPQSVKSAIGKRLDHVDPAHVDTLRLAAVLGKQFDFAELVAAAGGTGEDALLDALDAANAAQLITAMEGDRFAFTHDKIREVLYEELNPIRRRRLHQRAAAGLESLRAKGTDVAVEDLAHHCIEAGDHEKGYTYAMAAAREAERLFAFHEAMELYKRAGECAEGLDRKEAILDVAMAFGDACLKIGERVAAGAHFERALSLAEDPVLRSRLKVAVGSIQVYMRGREGLHYIEEALAELDPATQPALVSDAMTTKARYFHLVGRHRDAAALLEEAIAVVGDAVPPVTIFITYSFLAGAYQHLVDWDKSDAWARKCIEYGERTGLLIGVCAGLEFLAENRMLSGPWDEGVRLGQQEVDLARKLHSREREGWALMAMGTCHMFAGELPAGEERLRNSLDLAAATGDTRLAVLALANLSVCLTEQGRLDEAMETAKDTFTRGEKVGLLFMRCEGRRALAHVHLRRGEPAESVRLCEEIEKILEDADTMGARICMKAIHVEALADLGRMGEARKELTQYFEMLGKTRAPAYEAWAKQLEARLAKS